MALTWPILNERQRSQQETTENGNALCLNTSINRSKRNIEDKPTPNQHLVKQNCSSWAPQSWASWASCNCQITPVPHQLWLAEKRTVIPKIVVNPNGKFSHKSSFALLQLRGDLKQTKKAFDPDCWGPYRETWRWLCEGFFIYITKFSRQSFLYMA